MVTVATEVASAVLATDMQVRLSFVALDHVRLSFELSTNQSLMQAMRVRSARSSLFPTSLLTLHTLATSPTM